MKIEIDTDKLTLNDLIALEDGKMSGIKSVLVKFAVDDNGEPLPDASDLVGELTLPELLDAAGQITGAVDTLTPKKK